MASSNATGSRRAAALLLAAGGCLPTEQQHCSERAMTPEKARAPPSPARTPKRTSQQSQQQGQQPCPSPQATGDAAVPEALQLHAHMFDAMLTARGLLKRRNEKVTFQGLAPVVERSTGRAFKLTHLQQLKYIWPDAFQWQYIRAPCLQDNTKLEYQLLLTFEGAGGAAAAEDSGAGRVRDAAARSEFKRRLCDWQQQQQPDTTDTQEDTSQVDSQSTVAQGGHASQTDGGPDAQSIPCAPLPTRENAPRVGGSPSMSRGISSMGADSIMQSPASAAKGPASLGGRTAASPAPGRPPMSPTTHRSRGALSFAERQGSLGARAGSSILDVLQPARGLAPAGTPVKTEAPSPVAATPASRKRKADKSPQQDLAQEPQQGAGTHADDAVEAPGSVIKPRRRLVLGDSPDGKPDDAAVADGDAAAKQGTSHVAAHLFSPTKSARRPNKGIAAQGADREQTARTAIQSLQQIQKASTDVLSQVSAFAAASKDGAGPASMMSPVVNRQRTLSGAGAGMMSPAGRAPSGVMASPASASRPGSSLLSRFMSSEAMQELRRNSEAAPSMAVAAAEAARLHATSLLPAAMDLLRAIYGIKGPVVRPYDEVVELMRQKSSLHSGISSEEARTCLGLITQHAPEYAQIETQEGVRMLRINRAASVKMVRDKLKEVANTARAQLVSTDSAQHGSTGSAQYASTGA